MVPDKRLFGAGLRARKGDHGQENDVIRSTDAETPRLSFSVITVCKNSELTIAETVRSVAEQTGVHVEHIIKDAISTDNTVELAKAVNPDVKIIVQEDEGIYDAMNQGFAQAAGDVVAFLNSDDRFASSQVLRQVQCALEETGADLAYGDISIVNEKGQLLRHWAVGELGQRGMRGRQIPHPSLFVRRKVLEEIGLPFDPTYRISADYKQLLILIEKLGHRVAYVPQTITIMRSGGESTRNLRAVLLGWTECARAHREVLGENGWSVVLRKVLSKLRGLRFGLGRNGIQ